MNTEITNIESGRGQAYLRFWRRNGEGGWFLIQTATLGKDRRNQGFIRTLSAQQMIQPGEALELRMSAQSTIR